MHQFCLFEKTRYKVDNEQIISQKQGFRDNINTFSFSENNFVDLSGLAFDVWSQTMT